MARAHSVYRCPDRDYIACHHCFKKLNGIDHLHFRNELAKGIVPDGEPVSIDEAFNAYFGPTCRRASKKR